MSSPVTTYRWSFDLAEDRPLPDGDPRLGARSLEERLSVLVADRVSDSRVLVRAAAEGILAWAHRLERDAELSEMTPCAAATDRAEFADRLECGLQSFVHEHGWRGPAALFVDALRRAFLASGSGITGVAGDPLTGLVTELEYWLEAGDRKAWDGSPASPGARLRSIDSVVDDIAPEFDDGEELLCPSPSEVVTQVITRLAHLGRRPLVRTGICSGDGFGAIFARRLADAGVRVHLHHDAALIDQLHRADRVWIGTEAIGSATLIARVGTRSVCSAARHMEIPVECLCSGDDAMPGGAAHLPAWAAEETWHLLGNTPPGVRLHSQTFTEVPLTLVDRLYTDAGVESPAQLALRCLRTEPAQDLRGDDHDRVPIEARRDDEA